MPSVALSRLMVSSSFFARQGNLTRLPTLLIVLCKIDIKTRQGWMPRDFGTGFVLRKRLFEVCLAKLLPDALTSPPAKAEVEAIQSGSTSILMLTWSDLQSGS